MNKEKGKGFVWFEKTKSLTTQNLSAAYWIHYSWAQKQGIAFKVCKIWGDILHKLFHLFSILSCCLELILKLCFEFLITVNPGFSDFKLLSSAWPWEIYARARKVLSISTLKSGYVGAWLWEAVGSCGNRIMKLSFQESFHLQTLRAESLGCKCKPLMTWILKSSFSSVCDYSVETSCLRKKGAMHFIAVFLFFTFKSVKEATACHM